MSVIFRKCVPVCKIFKSRSIFTRASLVTCRYAILLEFIVKLFQILGISYDEISIWISSTIVSKFLVTMIVWAVQFLSQILVTMTVLKGLTCSVCKYKPAGA